MSKQATKRLRRKLQMEVNREPLPSFAWPGGYGIAYVHEDGGVICGKCVNENVVLIEEATSGPTNFPHHSSCGGWALAGWDCTSNYEEETVCDNCGEIIG